MGITCGRHTDSGDGEGNVCQTSLVFETKNDLCLDEAEATLRLKRWIYAWHEIRLSADNSRSLHKGMRARTFVDGYDEDFLDGWVSTIR